MPGNFNPGLQLPVEEDQTAALGFEPAVRNVIHVRLGNCPQCLEPMGIKGQNKNTIKVWTAEGIDYWCEPCVEKGLKDKTCLKYRHFSRKERKIIRKQLKKIQREKNQQIK
jgi:hypothetical protein